MRRLSLTAASAPLGVGIGTGGCVGPLAFERCTVSVIPRTDHEMPLITEFCLDHSQICDGTGYHFGIVLVLLCGEEVVELPLGLG